MDYVAFSKEIRIKTLKMIYKAKASHIGSCFSMIDILAVLYGGILRIDPKDPHAFHRDRCIISKGHAAAAVYATLALRGFFDVSELEKFYEGLLLGHVSHDVKGVEYSSGSLGHGLSIGCGMALASLRDEVDIQTYVVMSDGELNEGSTWEAILFAGHHKLHSLTAVIDYNKMQSLGSVPSIMGLEPLAEKFKSFGWDVEEVVGHNHQALEKGLKKKGDRPRALIAHTIKGRGIEFMEGKLLWHYKNPENYEACLEAIERYYEKELY